MNGERGSVVPLVAAITALALVGVVLLAGFGQVVAARARAAAAADAAALAAVAVTFRPFGTGGGPAVEAGRFAAEHGATVISCTCPVDRSYARREVAVTVEIGVQVLGVGRRAVRATSRAAMEPLRLLTGG